MKEPWYKKTIEENKKEVILSAIISLSITFIFSLWHYASGKPFGWHSISPISQPGFLAVEFYGIIAYFTIGAFLFYVLRFWQFLKLICVDGFGSWKLYNDAKWIVRVILALITQFYIVPTVVNWANVVISFFYNMWFLLLYAYPPIVIFLAIFSILIYLAIKGVLKPS
jgi:hypothetical protein